MPFRSGLFAVCQPSNDATGGIFDTDDHPTAEQTESTRWSVPDLDFRGLDNGPLVQFESQSRLITAQQVFVSLFKAGHTGLGDDCPGTWQVIYVLGTPIPIYLDNGENVIASKVESSGHLVTSRIVQFL